MIGVGSLMYAELPNGLDHEIGPGQEELLERAARGNGVLRRRQPTYRSKGTWCPLDDLSDRLCAEGGEGQTLPPRRAAGRFSRPTRRSARD